MDHSGHNMDHTGHNHADMHVGMDHGDVLSPSTTTTMTPDTSASVHNHHHQHHEAASSGEQGMLHHMMSMSFHFGYTETILFEWWKIDSVGGLIASMAAIFIAAALYEGIKFYREFLFWKTFNLLEYHPVTASQRNSQNGPLPNMPQSSDTPMQYVEEVVHKQPSQISTQSHIVQTILHMVQVTVSFVLMLIFMTYNVWLCFALVMGAAFGYFVFRWKRSVIVDVTEHCH